MDFYKCQVCKNIITYLNKDKCDVRCCGQVMVKFEPNTSDGAREKHVPVVEINGNTVKVTVGEVFHPMLDVHYIEWIMIETEHGRQRKMLKPGQEPVAYFELLEGDKVLAAYEYCNLHGLWKKEL